MCVIVLYFTFLDCRFFLWIQWKSCIMLCIFSFLKITFISLYNFKVRSLFSFLCSELLSQQMGYLNIRLVRIYPLDSENRIAENCWISFDSPLFQIHKISLLSPQRLIVRPSLQAKVNLLSPEPDNMVLESLKEDSLKAM